MICEAFSLLLGVDRVSITDSFFNLGGDSIKAMRMASAIRSKGYTVSVKDILNCYTPGSIALQTRKENIVNIEQGEVTGVVVETPIMRQFRSSQFGNLNHFNQSMMVPIDADMNTIREVLDSLVFHHDMLRAVYKDGVLKVLPFAESKKYELYEHDLRGVKDSAVASYNICLTLQKSIDIVNGPMVKATLLQTEYGKYLFICIHHLVIDGVSWRILLEDLVNAVKSRNEVRDIKLPEKTASFVEWSNLLKEYSNTQELAKERPYWSSVLELINNGRLVVSGANVPANQTVSFSLSEETTSNLLFLAGSAYNTQINDLLLASLGMAVREMTGQDTIAVGMEGHGRETIHRDICVDRTVGWFTTLYPVILHCGIDFEKSIIETKDMLREIPNHGLGYGLLHKSKMSDEIGIYFNYLGELESGVKDEKDVLLSLGEDVSNENRLAGYLNINSMVANGRFECHITFNDCSNEFAEGFANAFKKKIEGAVKWCIEQTHSHATASDFSDTTLTNEELSEFNDMF